MDNEAKPQMNVDEVKLNAPALAKLTENFRKGENTRQAAFEALVAFCVETFRPLINPKTGKVQRAFLTRVRDLLLASDLGSLASTYINPATTLAQYRLTDGSKTPTLVRYMNQNFTEEGGGSAHGEVSGPLFTPSRFNAVLGIMKKEEKWRDDPEQGLLLAGIDGTFKPFGAYDIKALKEVTKASKSGVTKSDLQRLVDLFGTPGAEDPKEQGSILKLISSLMQPPAATDEDDGEPSVPNPVMVKVFETTRGTVEEVREIIALELAAQREAEAKMAKVELEQRRLAREAAKGAARLEGANRLS